jgi:hypothetical protein
MNSRLALTFNKLVQCPLMQRQKAIHHGQDPQRRAHLNTPAEVQQRLHTLLPARRNAFRYAAPLPFEMRNEMCCYTAAAEAMNGLVVTNFLIFYNRLHTYWPWGQVEMGLEMTKSWWFKTIFTTLPLEVY